MVNTGTVVCGSAELAVDVQAVAASWGLPIATPVEDDPIGVATKLARSSEGAIGIALEAEPPLDELVALGSLDEAAQRMALLVPRGPAHAIASDFGVAAVSEVPALVSLLALAAAGAPRPYNASMKGLSALDRARLGVSHPEKRAGHFFRAENGLLRIEIQRPGSTVIGFAWDVAKALEAARVAVSPKRSSMPVVEGVDHQAVLDVILGPRRGLSDPASKAALEPYDLPLPVEELCGSPSRAAAEAARIGFPVRIALASPELRVSDHPDLVVDGVDSAAGVRDVFRQTMTLARSRSADARLLGVTVSASTAAKALLGVSVRRFGPSLALADVAFLDPHGAAASDRTAMVLPTTADGIDRALARLAGCSLLFGVSTAERRHVVSAIGDVVLRLAVFVHDWPDEIESVEICPLAVLVGGDVEIREARVQVTDAFTRSLEEPRSARRG
ncbi:MAG: acetate--CoA ligase family protein [Polyangiaceae bacterium]|nr:acetate--CoA ligase family protein [Polyangiaceae bacterium]